MRHGLARWIGLALAASFVLSGCAAEGRRTGLGDNAVWTGDSHRSGVKRATLGAVNGQTSAQRPEEGAGHSLI